MSFGERLATLRDGKSLTQNELAQLTKISRSRLSLYETNKREPDNATLLQLAEFFGVTTDYLLGSDGTSFSAPEIAKKPKDLQKILEQHDIMFSGTPLNDADKEAILDIVESRLYKRAKELNKRKKPGSDSL